MDSDKEREALGILDQPLLLSYPTSLSPYLGVDWRKVKEAQKAEKKRKAMEWLYKE